MSDTPKDPVDQTSNVGDEGKSESKKDVVTYETHRKLLDEKKKMQAERDQLLAEKKAKEEEDARKRGDLESLIKSREDAIKAEQERVKALEQEVTSFKQLQANASKLSSFLKTAGSDIDDKWLSLVDLSQIQLKETGEVDQISVASAVESFKKTWPEAFKKPGVQIPNAQPNGGAGMIAYSEWLKLSAKEMKKYKFEQIIQGK